MTQWVNERTNFTTCHLTSTEALWHVLPEPPQKRQTKLQRKNTHHRKSKSTPVSGQWDGWAAKGTSHQRHEPDAPSPTPQSCPLASMKMPWPVFPTLPQYQSIQFPRAGRAAQQGTPAVKAENLSSTPGTHMMEGQKWLKKVALWRHTKLTNCVYVSQSHHSLFCSLIN